MTLPDPTQTLRRDGHTVHHFELAVQDSTLDAVLVGVEGTTPRAAVVAIHATRQRHLDLVPELLRMASKGICCLAFDSPAARRAMAKRDPGTSISELRAGTISAIAALQDLPFVDPNRIALAGWRLGGEVAATMPSPPIAVIAVEPLLSRRQFLAASDHVLATGFRRYHGDGIDRMLVDLAATNLSASISRARGTKWLIQRDPADDRISEHEWREFSALVPRNVTTSSTADGVDERLRFLQSL